MKILVIVLATCWASTVLAVVPHDRRQHVQRNTNQPQRVLLLKMARALDRSKPVAALNSAGIAFAADKIIGNGDHNRVVAQTHEGVHVWSLPLTQPLSTPPVAIGEHVYLTPQSGELLSIDHTKGKLHWQTQLNSYVSRPLAFAAAIIVAATASQHLYAIDATSGKTMWLYDSDSSADVIVQGAAPPLITNKTIYYGTAEGSLVALDLHSGKQLRYWPATSATGRFRSIVGQLALPAPERLVFSNAAGLVTAIDPRNDRTQPQWQRQFSAITTSICRGDTCYIGLTKGEIIAIDNRDGSTRWHKKLGWSPTYITPQRDAYLYVSGSKGFITKLRTAHGSSVWQENLGSSIFAPPIMHRGMIFFSTSMRNVYAYRL